MKSTRFRFDAEPPTYAYALIGVVVGIAAVLVHNLLIGAGDFDLTGLLLGSVLAGFLARLGSKSGKRAGIGACVIGSLLAFGAWSYSLRARFLDTVFADGIGFAAVVVGIMVGVIVMWCAAIGAVGGAIGSWMAGKIAPEDGVEPTR